MEKYKLESEYSTLLLDPNFIKLELLYQKPNIFSALRLAHHEIRHSNFLGWLLDPNQTHGLGSKFLKLVLSDILLDERAKGISVTTVGKLKLEKAKIFREWKDIDVLIKIEDLIITIENKVWSAESKHQLQKYKNIIDAEFGASRKVFVFLTPFGIEASMNEDYISYSYKRIVSILQLITNSYYEAISSSVMVYLKDYIETIKTNFMANGDVNILAREVYLNHKELFDFVFNHTPNPLNELQEYFTKKLATLGWVPRTSNKHYVRFLPHSLNNIIPNNSTTWNKEAFLFEFFIKTERVGFHFTIPPGDGRTREILKNALSDFEAIVMDANEEYYCFNWLAKELEDIESFSHDEIAMDEYFGEFLSQVKSAVTHAEEKILAIKDDLIVTSN